jgi:uncharacterized protein involved in exopolysaccharide biosynthesis
MDALRAEGKTPNDRLFDGLKRLRRALTISSDMRSGIVSLAVVTSDSLLSAFVASAMLEELNDFNLQSHRSKGKAAREFLQQRLGEAESELSAAEAAITEFRNSNLRIGNSPTLLL